MKKENKKMYGKKRMKKWGCLDYTVFGKAL